MLYLLLGEDDYSLNQSLEEIKRGIGDQNLLATNTTILDGQQLTRNELAAVAETLPFLAERRLVIVHGLLARFEPKRKTSLKKKASQAPPNQYKSIADCICQLPESTMLVLIDAGISSRNPLLREIAGKAKVRSFPLLKEPELGQWIERRVTEEGGSISPQARDQLAKAIGSNLWHMASEVSKLVSFTSGRRIETEDVARVVSYARETSVFTMVDAILEFKASVAEQTLQQLLQAGATPAYLLVMLTRQVRLMVRVKELLKQRQTSDEIQSRLGLTSEFALRKTMAQAGRYPLERLRETYHQLLEADLSIKTGRYNAELALNILIAELCQPREVSA